MHDPWQKLSEWEPFRVDALGLITLLGAEDIDTWVGRLVPSRWLEYMPLLAMYVIAADRFRRKTPSFLLYNISKGIHTTDCAAWFTRWIQCQNFQTTRSIVYWETVKRPRSQVADHLTAGAISFVVTGFLLIMTVLSYDLYGIANVVAIIATILTRAYILHANRTTIDHSIPGFGSGGNTEKMIIITPDAKVISMFIPNSIIVPLFIQNPEPRPMTLYKAARWIHWLAFGVHVITLGMATLATQIYTVSVIILSSILICAGFGCADMARAKLVQIEYGDTRAYTCWIGSHLKATVFEWPSHFEFRKIGRGTWDFRDNTDPCTHEQLSTKRMDLYAWLNLTPEEEDSLEKWDLLPHKRGSDSSWNEDFKAKQELVRERCPNMWRIKQSISQAYEGRGSVLVKQDDRASVSGAGGAVLPFYQPSNSPSHSAP
ncbi:hypothetical protein BDW74DRAFT_158414 [Aspergillus multicolor]|uniref:uncharacterized protein n=1 Tax=Aspergillus multicolor TaxID=41759 RepID=UPI003CCD4D93